MKQRLLLLHSCLSVVIFLSLMRTLQSKMLPCYLSTPLSRILMLITLCQILSPNQPIWMTPSKKHQQFQYTKDLSQRSTSLNRNTAVQGSSPVLSVKTVTTHKRKPIPTLRRPTLLLSSVTTVIISSHVRQVCLSIDTHILKLC